MTDDAPSSVRCALCGKSLDSGEPRVGVPDLLIEMHESCYRPPLDEGLRRDAASSARR
jgi:hypothetical protein